MLDSCCNKYLTLCFKSTEYTQNKANFIPKSRQKGLLEFLEIIDSVVKGLPLFFPGLKSQIKRTKHLMKS